MNKPAIRAAALATFLAANPGLKEGGILAAFENGEFLRRADGIWLPTLASLIPLPIVYFPASGGATWSATDKTANVVLSNQNKDADSNSTAATAVRSGTHAANNTGKYYCEINLLWDNGPSDAVSVFGIDDAFNTLTTPNSIGSVPADMYVFRDDGKFLNGGGQFGGTNWDNSVAHVGMLAFDTTAGAGKIWFGLDGVWEGSPAGNPQAGTNAQYSGISNVTTWSVYTGAHGTGPGLGHLHNDIRSAVGETTYAPPAGFSRF